MRKWFVMLAATALIAAACSEETPTATDGSTGSADPEGAAFGLRKARDPKCGV